MKTRIKNYTFNKTEKTITFIDYSTIELDGILGIVNAVSKIEIYNFMNPLKGGTVLNNVLTLDYDTSSMNNTDKLIIYYDDIIDGKNLFSGNITTISQGISIDTSGYSSMIAQFSGVWYGKIYFETSNDGVNWDNSFILSRDELSLQDVIDQNGVYSIKRSGRYIRYNCQKIVGTAVLTIVGRDGEGLSAADLLSFAMDRTNNTPLQVQLPVDLKQDSTGALVLADMKGPIYWNSGNAASPLILDCTGYSTAIVQKTTAGIVTPTISLDGINFVATVAMNISSATAVASTIPTATGVYLIPIVGKYLKLTGPASSVQCTIYLSVTPFVQDSGMPNPPVNLTQIAGTAAVTAGVAGTLSVGGNIAHGAAPTTYPLQIGGVDNLKGSTAALTALIRRVLVDYMGRLQVGTHTGNAPGTSSDKSLNEVGYLADYKNVLEVRDTQRIDGQSIGDLFVQIILELKIMNQQLYELPRILQNGSISQDEPESFRNEQSLFK